MQKIAEYLTYDERYRAVYDENGQKRQYVRTKSPYSYNVYQELYGYKGHLCNDHCPLGYALSLYTDAPAPTAELVVELIFTNERFRDQMDAIRSAAAEFTRKWDSGLLKDASRAFGI